MTPKWQQSEEAEASGRSLLVPDIIIASKKDPLSLVEYVEELTDNFI